MKYAILSDIHGNFDAFERVLSDINPIGVDRIISLGDMIGYGGQPEEVVTEIRRRSVWSIMGNHELAVVDRSYLNWFNPQARRSLVQTITMLSPDSLAFIEKLKAFLRFDSCHFVHGYPPDSPLTYLFEVGEETLVQTFLTKNFWICFVGHTHNLEIISFGRDGLSRLPLQRGKTILQKTNQYILNIGSVGQPRNGNVDAKYVIWDPEENTVDLRFIPYNLEAAADKILAAGLPEVRARRLLPK